MYKRLYVIVQFSQKTLQKYNRTQIFCFDPFLEIYDMILECRPFECRSSMKLLDRNETGIVIL